jgi:PQQ enzyme repeat
MIHGPPEKERARIRSCMRHVRVSLFCLVSLCLIALVTGCGSTVSGGSGGGGSTDGTFTLGASPAVTIAQGSSQTFTVTPSSANNFTGSIQVSVSGLPSGVTVSPATATVAVGSSTTFTLMAAADAVVGTTTVKVYGASGTLSTSIPVALTVTASGPSGPPSNADFTLKATPSTLALAPGASGQVTLSSTAMDGFSGAIAVTVAGVPTGVTVSPSTISVTVNNPLVITLTAASDAPATATPVQVRFIGTSGKLSHTAAIQLTITVVGPTGPDFSITATPDTMTVAQGLQSGEVQIAVTGTNGFSGDVTYTVSGLPTGVTVIPSSSTLQSGWTEPMVFQATADAPIGNATVTITGTSGVLTHNATVALTVTAPPPPDFVALVLSPTDLTIKAGSIGTVSVTATATDGYTGTIDVSVENLPTGVTMSPVTAALTPGVPQTFTLAAAITAQPATSTVTFLGQVNSASGTADLNLTIAASANNPLDVTTWHNDMARTGLYASETRLTPTTVSSAKFLKFGVFPTDGAVDAQPLFVSLLKIGTVVHNVLYFATENGTLYAMDANTGAPLWGKSALGTGETAADNQGCSELSSKVGITSTPVIDRNYGTDGAIFFVAKTKDSDGNYHQRLHALDLITGAELDGSPTEIAATYPANGGATKTFDPSISVERSALLLSNGTVYLSWGAPCHQTTFDYDGWVMAYNEGTLQQQSVLDVTPNGSGGGIWMSGAGPAGDANGNVFLATSEGTFDTTLNNGAPANSDYGNGFLKIQSPNGVLNVFDYFEPLNGVPGAANYQDQGSGGVMLTPAIANGLQAIFPAAIGAGMDGNIYLLKSSGNVLGEYDGTTDNNFNTLTGALPTGATSSPAYFNGAFYYGGSSDAVRQFTLTASGATLASQSANTLGGAGATPVISANGTQTAILWALDTTASGGAVLNAYDATNVATQLYSSSAKPGDAIGPTGKFTVPTVANGYVYVGTNGGVAIFGLFP